MSATRADDDQAPTVFPQPRHSRSTLKSELDAAILTVGIFAFAQACHTHYRPPPAAPPRPPIVCAGIVTTGSSALAAAPAIIAKALSGVFDRGEQDVMLRMEAKLPGFGGWFLAGDTFNVYLKPTSTATVEDVRKILYDMYSSRPEGYVQRLMRMGPQVKIVPARYSLSELIAIEHLVAADMVALRVSGAGTSLIRNRVVVGFIDSASVCPGAAALASMGVPVDALLLEVWGIIRGL